MKNYFQLLMQNKKKDFKRYIVCHLKTSFMVYCRKMKRQHDSNLSSNWDLNTFYIQIYFPELKTSGQWTIKIPLPSKYVIFVMRSVYIDSFSFVLFTNFSCCTHTRYIQQNKIRTPKKNLKSIHFFSTIITEMFMCALCKLNLTKMYT